MENPLRERLRVLTMIESGARARELRGLQLGDYDLYRKTIVVTGKGSKRRLIPISAELAATVDEYMLTEYPLLDRTPAATDYLWYGVYRVGQRVIGLKLERELSYRGFCEWWRRVEATAGVRHRKPHMTRHTFATDVLDATEGDLYAVKELLGHSSTRVTRGLSPLVEDANGERRQSPDRVPARKQSNRRGTLGRMRTGLKATSGFEPLYEALQASA